jgi:hypothetical protein
MSDTPETDSAFQKGMSCKEVFEFAQRLERERDKARRQLEDLDVAAIHSCHDQCQRPMCVLRRERDKARDELQHWQAAGLKP